MFIPNIVTAAMAQWVERSHAEDRVFESLPRQTWVVDQAVTVPRKTLANGLCFPYKRMPRVIFGAAVKAPSARNGHMHRYYVLFCTSWPGSSCVVLSMWLKHQRERRKTTNRHTNRTNYIVIMSLTYIRYSAQSEKFSKLNCTIYIYIYKVQCD